MPVHIVRDVALHVQIAGAVAGHRHQHHDQPVRREQPDDPRDLPAQRSSQIDRRGDRIADGDPLQHPQKPQGVQVEFRKTVEEQPERIQDRRPPQDLEEELRTGRARCHTLRQRQRHRHPDDPQKRRKDHIGDGPAVPLGMVQRTIRVAPVAGRVHDHHQGDGRAAKGVERYQAGRRRRLGNDSGRHGILRDGR